MLALVALGYTMVFGVLKHINFARSEVFMMGAYAGFLLMTMLGVLILVPLLKPAGLLGKAGIEKV
jgi:branched-chain amino acid transport system permease protein